MRHAEAFLSMIQKTIPDFVYKFLQLSNNTIRNDDEFIKVYWQLAKEKKMMLSIREAYNIYLYVKQASKLCGALAEVGTYRGGGAKLISTYKKDLPLHIFDSFEGMEKTDDKKDIHQAGDFAKTSLNAVKDYLKDFDNIHFHKGWFPDTAIAELPDDMEFCFVHLDGDLYESTLSGLEYFYPRMKKGGVIISHDYNSISCPGVKQAYDEYFADKEQLIIPLFDTQVMLIK